MNLKKLIIIMSISIVCIIGIVALIVNLNKEPVKLIVTDLTKDLGYSLIKQYHEVSDKDADKYLRIETMLGAYNSLVEGEESVILSSTPSKEVLNALESQGVEIEIYPVAKDGLVFMNNKINLITGLEDSEVKKIYSKILTNWNEVGGDDLGIIAYQSKTDDGLYHALKNFLGDYDLESPKIRLKNESLDGLINALTKYLDTRKAALGYTNFGSIKGKELDSQIRILKLNGVEPTTTTIYLDEYPGVFDICLIVRKDSLENSQVKKLVEYIQSEKGQTFIRESGYINVRN